MLKRGPREVEVKSARAFRAQGEVGASGAEGGQPVVQSRFVEQQRGAGCGMRQHHRSHRKSSARSGRAVPEVVQRERECGHVDAGLGRSEEHTSELQSLMRISYAVFCLKKKKHTQQVNS